MQIQNTKIISNKIFCRILNGIREKAEKTQKLLPKVTYFYTGPFTFSCVSLSSISDTYSAFPFPRKLF